MRPWHFSHGNMISTAAVTLDVHCFNEAVAFQPRKSVDGSNAHAQLVKLQ